MIEEDPSPEVPFVVTSIFGTRTRQPIVGVRFGDVEYQIAPEEAKRLAFMLLEGAEASLQDANVYRFMKGTVGLDDQRAAQVLGEFRALRSAREEQAGPVIRHTGPIKDAP